MSDGLKISEHIYSHTLFGDKCEFSGLGALTEFFSSVPQAVQERWPFDLSDKGYRTFYEQALIVSEQLGFVSRLHLRARITKGEETYAVSRKICFEDDKMVFVHDSLRREKGAAGANFAHLLMARTRDFLQAYDQIRKICYKNEHSEIFCSGTFGAERKNSGLRRLYLGQSGVRFSRQKRSSPFSRQVQKFSFRSWGKNYRQRPEKVYQALPFCRFRLWNSGCGR